MIKLNSFSDIEAPVGLFPSDMAFYLEGITSRTVNYLAGLSLQEVNESLAFVRYFMRETSNMNIDNEFSKTIISAIKKELNRNDRYVPPDKEIDNDVLLIQMLDKSFFGNKEKYLREDINDNDRVEGVLEAYKKMCGSMSLYYYMLGLGVGRRENRKNTSKNNEFYRLGKSSPYFFASNYILNIVSQMQSEVKAVTQKEFQLQDKRRESASKGGKKKNNSFKDLKKKCINTYITSHKSKSNRKASVCIYDALHDNDKRIFRGDDPSHQIALWIGQYNKGTLKTD